MPHFRVHRMKESPRQQYHGSRSAPWTLSGTAQVRPRDYENAGQVAASNEYQAWTLLRESGSPIQIGDLLETEQGQLRICKYVGFEAAQWIVPEPKPAPGPEENGRPQLT